MQCGNGLGAQTAPHSLQPIFDIQSGHLLKIPQVGAQEKRFVSQGDAGDFQVLRADFCPEPPQFRKSIGSCLIPAGDRPFTEKSKNSL
jgi:hypothetical protein